MNAKYFLFLALMLPLGAWAQSKMVLFGDIVLGEPLTLQECPRSTLNRTFKASCVVRNSRGATYQFASTDVTPRYVKPGYDVTLSSLNNAVGEVSIVTGGVLVQEQALAALIEKFGQPLVLKKSKTGTVNGVVYEAIRAAWMGNGLTVQFESPVQDVWTGMIIIATDEFLTQQDKTRTAKKTL